MYSDSNDSEGQVSPSVVYMVGGEGSNGTSRIAIGHGYINDTQANTCNGFQLPLISAFCQGLQDLPLNHT